VTGNALTIREELLGYHNNNDNNKTYTTFSSLSFALYFKNKSVNQTNLAFVKRRLNVLKGASHE